MPHIIPISDLKNTGAISQLCHESGEPVYVTKNGYGDLVVMSMDTYEKKLFMLDVYNKLAESEADVAARRTKNAKESLKNIRGKYDV